MNQYIGVVKSSSVASGAASSLTYTVVINRDGTTMELTGQKSVCNRPPDSIDTLAAKPGTVFLYVEVSPGVWGCMIQEFPDFAACTTGAA